MKMKSVRYILSALFLGLMVSLACVPDAGAQGKNRKARKAKAVEISSCVIDAQGHPIKDAVITSGEGSTVCRTDAQGRFSVKSSDNEVILVEADGYEDLTVTINVGRLPKSITLTESALLAGSRDILDRMDGGSVTRRENTSSISTIDAALLRRYPDLSISNSLQGQAAGLIVNPGLGGQGSNSATLYVRGQHDADSPAIVVIDGMERTLDGISPEEIESIQVMKDAPAKILYGPRAANGVVLITTRRGEAHKRVVNASVQYGTSISTRVPSYLGAYEYAQLYNEARENDGLSPVYSSSDLEGYRTSTGENDFRYPDVDWQERFLRSSQNYRKVSAEFLGGNSTMKYALITSYIGASGLEKVGTRSSTDRINLRGNLDMRINEFITAKADVAARLELKSAGQVSQADLFKRVNTMRPNEYPLTISAEKLGLAENTDGTPYFGGSTLWTSNLLDDMQYGGNSADRYVVSQTDLGLDFNLSNWTPGLKAEAYLTFDNYSYISQSMTKYHQTYAVRTYLDDAGNQAYDTFLVRKLNESDDIVIGEDLTKRTIGARGSVSYERSSGRSDFSAVASFRYYYDKGQKTNQDCITTSSALRLDYSYGKRFFAEAVLGVMGSNQLSSNHRYIFTPAVSLGWIALTEPFVKVKASAGRMGYDPNTDYLLYSTTWTYPGSYSVGDTGSGVAYRTALNTYGNPDLGWTTSNEADFGFESRYFGNRLSLDGDVFMELRDGGITTLSNSRSTIVGNYIMSLNHRRVLNRGAELTIAWADRSANGDFSYRAGLNLTVTKNKILQLNQLEGIEEWRSSVGRPSSAIFALESEGLFGKDVALAGHAVSTYGECIEGDIAYKDQNSDGVIDDRDKTYLGQTFPVTTWGLNLELKYKGFGFYALGTAETGASTMLTNTYYMNTGTNAYSVLARERYHSTNNPDGTLPRLTTADSGNSYRASSFWMEDASFFRLKNLELSYTFDRTGRGSWFKTCKVFVQGTNLFVLSAIKNVDPELKNAGVSSYPVYRTICGGLSVSF